MARLRSDVGGNTLAIMAIALIPMCALAGSGVDTARLYVVKVRLQQACDAGVLAGRKAMQTQGTLNDAAKAEAKTFFANNFQSGFMGTPTFSSTSNPYPFTPVQTADNQVAGSATTTVPMAIMKMFGAAPVTMTVNCQARFDTADADIMFVLDTTGSMSATPSGPNGTKKSYTRENGTLGWFDTEQNGSKISGLRTAVLHFYDTVAASADPSTHIRYGFVPYSVTVNVGEAIRSLNPAYLVNSWNYNTRVPAGEANDDVYATSTSNTKNTARTSCAVGVVRTPATGYTVGGKVADGNSTATAVRKTTTWSNSNGGTCTVVTDNMKIKWIYKNAPIDVSQIKSGASTTDPTRFSSNGDNKISWLGCIEERQTTFGVTTFYQDALPADLDPDLIPNSDATRWKPALPELSYWRNSDGSTFTSSGDTASSANSDWASKKNSTTKGTWMAINYQEETVACPKAAKRLGVMTRADIQNYMATSGDFHPSGNTYHDTGMIWGTRMIAPDGPFGNDTKSWPGRNTPNRYIVFMTDGEMVNAQTTYNLWGVEQYDKRIGNTGSDTSYHNARFLAECAAAKARGISVFVIGFGQPIKPGDPLDTCASPGQAIYASDNAKLDAAFQTIAKRVALLRLSQ